MISLEDDLDYTKELNLAQKRDKIYHFFPIGGPYLGNADIGAGIQDISALTIIQNE